eukprot:7656606-Prorocentrum_lima.AAC.1
MERQLRAELEEVTANTQNLLTEQEEWRDKAVARLRQHLSNAAAEVSSATAHSQKRAEEQDELRTE